MISHLSSLGEYLRQIAYGPINQYASLAVIAFLAFGLLIVVLRAAFVGAKGLSKQDAARPSLSLRHGLFKIAQTGSFVVMSVIMIFMAMTSMAVFGNAVFMLIIGSEGLLRAEDILLSPRTDGVIYLVLSVLYGAIALAAYVAAFALWPLRAAPMPWADILDELPKGEPGGRFRRILVLQTFSVVNYSAILSSLFLLYNVVKYLDAIALQTGVFFTRSDSVQFSADTLVHTVLLLTTISAVTITSAHALWPLRRA